MPDPDLAPVGAAVLAAIEHTHAMNCRACQAEEGTAKAPNCVHARFTAKRIRFREAHAEAFQAAYENPDPSSAQRELERLEREYATLPPRHDCSCRCPYERTGGVACPACRKLRHAATLTVDDTDVPTGHRSPVNAPMPDPVSLDLAAARGAGATTPRQMARHLNGERAA